MNSNIEEDQDSFEVLTCPHNDDLINNINNNQELKSLLKIKEQTPPKEVDNCHKTQSSQTQISNNSQDKEITQNISNQLNPDLQLHTTSEEQPQIKNNSENSLSLVKTKEQIPQKEVDECHKTVEISQNQISVNTENNEFVQNINNQLNPNLQQHTNSDEQPIIKPNNDYSRDMYPHNNESSYIKIAFTAFFFLVLLQVMLFLKVKLHPIHILVLGILAAILIYYLSLEKASNLKTIAPKDRVYSLKTFPVYLMIIFSIAVVIVSCLVYGELFTYQQQNFKLQQHNEYLVNQIRDIYSQLNKQKQQQLSDHEFLKQKLSTFQNQLDDQQKIFKSQTEELKTTIDKQYYDVRIDCSERHFQLQNQIKFFLRYLYQKERDDFYRLFGSSYERVYEDL